MTLKSASVVTHPLLPNRPRPSIKYTDSSKNDPLIDPLSVSDPLSGRIVISDPLSHPSNVLNDPLANPTKLKTVDPPLAQARRRPTSTKLDDENPNTPWHNRKQKILREYAMSGNIILNSAAFNGSSAIGLEDGSATRYLDKYTQRMANLERRGQVVNDTKVELTQKEYTAHVEKLSSELKKAWANDEMVPSLTIAMQLAKLLTDTTAPQFYPSTFVMVTEALDAFGELVFNRVRSKAYF